MQPFVRQAIQDSIATKNAILENEELVEQINACGERLKEASEAGGTVYVCGNGGSACDAMHFVEELVARYKSERRGYRAMHFLDASTLSCWSNDYEFNTAFERQAQVFCKKGDVFVGISTSGNSENVLKAVKAAKANGAYTIGLLGKDGGSIKAEVDAPLVVPSNATERIQEAHIMFIHIFCEFYER